jgi:hypothetical protein
VQADEDTPGHLFSRAVRRAKLHACRQALRRGAAIADAGHPASGAGSRWTVVQKKQFKRSPDRTRALVHPDFVRISQSTDNIERMATNLLASSPDTSDQRPTEGFTRALSIGAATVSILAAGLALHPAPQATAPESAHAGTHADPFGLQSADGGHSLPTQKTEDLF